MEQKKQQEQKLVPKESSSLSKETDRELFEPLERSIGGPPMFIKNPLERLDKVFNFQREQYMVLGSVTGTGKTSIVDHFILSIIQDYPKDMHFEVLYYSMERKKKFKFAKWLSWRMKVSENIRVSSDTIMNRNGKLSLVQLKHIRNKHGDWLENTMSYVDLREGAKSVKEISDDIDRLARKLGDVYHTDSAHIYKNDKFIKALNTDQFIVTRYGKRLFTRFTINNKQYTLYQNDSIYVTLKPSVVFIVIDHIGKVKIEKNKKETLDRLDDVLSNARDKYSFSPIAISQFNRAVGNIDRQKLHKGNLAPILEDFKDTGNLTESADLVLSLFDPARYSSWDAQGEYKGINIRDSTITPIGQQRTRSLHILKNTFGYDNAQILLRFTGESMFFSTMPLVTDTTAISKMYKEISKGE